MRRPKRLRLIIHILCLDEWHDVGLTRQGRLIPLQHTPAQLRRWEQLAELGGRLPACCSFARRDPVKDWLRGIALCISDLTQVCGRIVYLRATRASARDAPGQGKRNRRATTDPMISFRPRPTPKRPSKKPSLDWQTYYRRPGDWRNRYDRNLSRYRREHKGVCPGPHYGIHKSKKRVFYENRDQPADRRRR